MKIFIAFLFFLFGFQTSFAQRNSNSLFAPPSVSAQSGTGAIGQEGAYYREQAYHVPLKGMAGQRVAALLYRPNGNQAAPLIVMTHGTEGNDEKNRNWKTAIYPHAIEWFVSKGYAVALVYRRGYGLTGGKRAEGGSCDVPNHVNAGSEGARDILSVVDYMVRLPFVKDKGVVVVGQSTGGWSALSVAAQNHPAVKGVINFAGGRRGVSGKDGSTCMLDELVRDASLLGMRAKTPSLWIYAANDQTFPLELVKRMYIAYSSGGAPTQFHMLESFGRDGHSMFPSPRGVPMWGGLVKAFIEK